MRKAIALMLLAVATQCLAAVDVRYVSSTDGDDSENDGKTADTPWETLGKVQEFVESTDFDAGDTIYFHQGSVWKDDTFATIKPKIGAKGTVSAPIHFTSYIKTGENSKLARPILDARTTLDLSLSWTQVGTTDVWQTSAQTEEVKRLWIDEEEQRSVNKANEDETDVDSDDPWFYDGGTDILYLYAPGGPSTFYSGSEIIIVADFKYVIDLEKNNDYINISNLALYGGALYSLRVRWSKGNEIFKNDVFYSKGGIQLTGNENQPAARNIKIYNNNIDGKKDLNYDYDASHLISEGIELLRRVKECEIFNNTIIDWGHNCILLKAQESGGQFVKDNKIYRNLISAPNSTYCAGIALNGAEDYLVDNQIYNNIFRDLPLRSVITGKRNEFYNNIFDTTREEANNPATKKQAYGLQLIGRTANLGSIDLICEDNKVYNNTFYNTADAGILLRASGANDDPVVKNNSIINNLFLDCGSASTEPSVMGCQISEDKAITFKDERTSNDGIGDNTIENNLVFNTNMVTELIYIGDASSGTCFTAADFNDEDNDYSNNINSDPDLEKPEDQNFRLKTGSGAENEGVDVTVNGSTRDSDFYGNPIVGVAMPDIGAIEISDPEIIAFNDLAWFSNQISDNITTFTRTEDGFLKHYNTGATTDLAICITGGASTGPALGGAITSGSDAYGVFDGNVDTKGVISGTNTVLEIEFSDLDSDTRYDIIVFGNRDKTTYTNRTTEVTISYSGNGTGLEDFINESTVGVAYSGTASTIIPNGYNPDGYVARFSGIKPNTSGGINIIVSAPIPSSGVADQKFYVNAVMLKEY